MRVLLAFACLTAWSGCAGSPRACRVGADESYEAESLAGARAAEDFEPSFGGVVRDGAAEARLARIGALLVEHNPGLARPYQYRLLCASALNAASLPAGRIYITRGLYAHLTDDGLLAAVLAHEMAHLRRGDSLKPRCTSLDEGLARECAADESAAEILRRSGLDASRLVDVLALIAPVQPAGWVDARRRALDAALRGMGADGEP